MRGCDERQLLEDRHPPWREAYQRQAELTRKSGLDGQAQLTSIRKELTELGPPGGHIGMFVWTKSQGIVGKGMVDWLVERDS